MPLIDSHAHLTDPKFEADRDEAIQRAREAGVTAIVSIASTAADAERAIALAARTPGVFATAGIHPHSVAAAAEGDWARVRELSTRPEVVAIGETGLDHHYDFSPRALQRERFLWHLELARERDLPVVVHCRDADDELRAILQGPARGTRGVLHCFAGDRALLDAGLETGWYVSFSGMVTFARYDAADLLRAVPGDRLLVETDSPYLAPAPLRGKRNEPAFVARVADRVAELRGEDAASLRERTARNARTLFRLTGELVPAAAG